MALIEENLGDKMMKTSIMPKITEQKHAQVFTKVHEKWSHTKKRLKKKMHRNESTTKDKSCAWSCLWFMIFLETLYLIKILRYSWIHGPKVD